MANDEDAYNSQAVEIALVAEYSEADDELRRVVAKGMGALAELIERLAESHGAPLTRNAELAQMLTRALPAMDQETDEYRVLLKVLGCLYELESSA